MMLQKHFHHKRKPILAILLSAFLGLSLCMNFIPLNTHAEGEPMPGEQSEDSSSPITLTYNGQPVDFSIAYITNTENTGEKYDLSSIREGTTIIPPGIYSLYISDSETQTDIPVQDFTLTVDPDAPIQFSVNYFCVRFIDRENLISKQYIIESGSCSEPVVSENRGHQWLGWSDTPTSSIRELPAAITEDVTLYGIWERLVDPVTEPTSDSDPTTEYPNASEQTPPTEQPDDPGTEIPEPEVPHAEHQYVWKYTETEHWQICTAEGTCDAATINRAAHSFDNGTVTKEATETTEGETLYTCGACGYQKTEILPKLPHTHKYENDWKSDNTSHWHECRCGSRNEVKPHIAGEWIIDEQATASTEGSKHKECTTCKKVLQTEVIPKPISPTITAGANQIYHTGSGAGLTVTCSGSFADLTGVYADNSLIHKSNYTAAEGSTVLTLHPAYLDNLAGGTHTLTLAYKDGTSAQTQFTIQKTNSTIKTGDNENYIPLIILLILSGGVMIVTAVLHKKGLKG